MNLSLSSSICCFEFKEMPNEIELEVYTYNNFKNDNWSSVLFDVNFNANNQVYRTCYVQDGEVQKETRFLFESSKGSLVF